MADAGGILVEREGPVVRLTLSHAARQNAISAGMWQDLASFCFTAAGDRDLRAVVVTGQGAIPIGEVAWPERVALVVGAEGPGLRRETIARAGLRVRIPMASGVDSLNVAMATGVALSWMRLV